MPPQCAIVPRDVNTAISGKAVHGLRKIFACEFFLLLYNTGAS